MKLTKARREEATFPNLSAISAPRPANSEATDISDSRSWPEFPNLDKLIRSDLPDSLIR